MPELPEVETVVRGLRRTIVGRSIIAVSLKKTDFIDDAVALEKYLPGQKIVSVERYGKFMLLRFSARSTPANHESTALLVHLGMTGHIASFDVVNAWEKHTHVGMLLDDGRELRYTDARRFGRMAYLAGETLDKELARFGVDPLEMSKREFAQRIRSRSARIKALLLDQRVLRGVGNIYADESLWKARIHPARLGSRLTLAQASVLHRSLQQILRRAIVLRGSTISNFADTDGLAGEYQQHHQVYGREGQRCYRCRKTIRRAIVAGRSSYFCPRCQGTVKGTHVIPKKKKRTKLPQDRRNTKV
ncbi:MAG TPA: DNA-formamidopyrimidine glycosylase [Candidatus Dormibacteraeota bacterium]|nr:DNA-formamidopyrimidine glycosylase [Candidatus Dormibacteraeota bacterium]